MTYILDERQREVQDAIANDSFTNGESDAFDGRRPESSSFEYLLGYRQGLQRFSDHLQHQAFLLQQEGQQLETAIGEF